jgi:DNA-binding transcriptional ArsR family regulator
LPLTTPEAAVEALSALAHPSRLAVFRLLVRAGRDGVAAGEVARLLDTPPNTMSTQLAILSRSGLITSRRESRSVIYQADYGAFSELLGFLVEDCCDGRPEVCTRLADVVQSALRCAGDHAVATGDLR